MLSRRFKILFWLIIGAVLALGLGQVFALPTQPSATSSSPVIITEFAASNGGETADEDGDYADWIELYNRSSVPQDLEGWTLTDDPTQPDKWTFRSLKLDGGEYLIVFASGKNRRTVREDEGRPYAHTNFRLEADGGFLGLYSPTSRRFLDASEYSYPVQYPGVSYGVLPGESVRSETMRHFEHATPGAENDASAAWVGVLEPVTLSVPHGVYSEPLTLSMSHPDPQAQIRYTTDGSIPTVDSTLYTDTLHIQSTTPLRVAAFRTDMRRSHVTTRTYIFPEDLLSQGDRPPGFPATWGTHTIDFGGYAASTPVEADYAMDARIVDDPAGAAQVVDALESLPAISLVLEMQDFESLYANPRERGPDWERPVSVELVHPDDGGDGFQIDAGLRVQGGAGRWEFMPKHPFRLFFKQRYGASKLNHEMFADSPVTSFDTLVLRAGVDRAFAGHPSTPDLPVNHRDATYLRDEWARASQIAMSGSGSHGTFAHLYINGLYWGLYNVIERPDASFAAAHLGGDKDDWFSANHGGAVSGRPDRFNVMLDLARQGGLEDPERYATMLEFVDPEHFSDYLIVNWYAGNRDWPENNWYANVENPAGRNRFFVWDAEGTWDDGAAIVLGSDGLDGAPYPNVVKLVFEALMQNPDFRVTFADRLYRHLNHGGALTDNNARQRWLDLAQLVEPAIPAESARWGDVRYERPVTLEDWRIARDNVLAQMEGNGDKLIALARDAGYYPDIDPPIFSQQGGEFASPLALEILAPSTGQTSPVESEIYYTTDGSDPRRPGSGDPAGRRYVEPIELTTATTVKARAFVNGQWSAINEARFRRPGQRSNVRITEIMYHPVGDEEAEFLELMNDGDVTAELTGVYMEGVEFRFADGAQIGPGQRIVLIRDLKEFRRRYPEVEVFGIYNGKLSDRGERISLFARDGTEITTVAYDDENGWPLSADGAGDSIVLQEDSADDQDPASWRASKNLYGSPGEAE